MFFTFLLELSFLVTKAAASGWVSFLVGGSTAFRVDGFAFISLVFAWASTSTLNGSIAFYSGLDSSWLTSIDGATGWFFAAGAYSTFFAFATLACGSAYIYIYSCDTRPGCGLRVLLGVSPINYAVFDVSPLLLRDYLWLECLPEVPLLGFLSSWTCFLIIISTDAYSGSASTISTSFMGSAFLDFGVLASPDREIGSILTGVDTLLLLRLMFCGVYIYLYRYVF